MKRVSLPVLAALSTAMALCPVMATAQSASASAERAELELPALSSSSSPDLYAPAAQSSITIGPPPVANRPAAAAEGGAHPFSGIGIGVKVGVAGVGFDVATPLVRGRLNLRGGASFFSYNNASFTEDNINITGSLKLQNSSAMIDWFPFHGGFRISAGATTYNNTGVTATLAVPAGQSFTLGGTTYYSQPGNPITGNGVFTFGGNKIAPRFTIGSGNMLPVKGRLRLTTEIGFQYIDQPTVAYTISGGGCTGNTGSVYTNCGPIPQSSVVSEQNELQNDLKDLRFYPVFSIGLSYKIH